MEGGGRCCGGPHSPHGIVLFDAVAGLIYTHLKIHLRGFAPGERQMYAKKVAHLRSAR